ncbi:low temperature requirement protein A [[Kitasatospora] papulosa]|uniref:low temperature requirement protein A n=1 Tax=[Kitasatospora] papulosa TaxID=1464011 RepID=UPI00367DAD8D
MAGDLPTPESSSPPQLPPPPAHRARRLTGRDPSQPHRTATPLELFFDLTFVVSFGMAADELAHYLVEGHPTPAIVGFAIASLALVWAWTQCTWFASAYDTDDWVWRAATFVQMAGVVVMALGLEPMFHSLETGEAVNNGLMVAGYVVLRLPLVLMWLRAARHDPARSPTAHVYAATILIAQVGWVGLALARTSTAVFAAFGAVLLAVEVSGPVLAERRGPGTPWHPHHLAERFGLLVIITLGEGLFGTVAAINAVVHREGWTLDTALTTAAGLGLTVGCWWMYFAVPWGHVLKARPGRVYAWSYVHIPVFASVAAIGAGIHVAAYYLEHQTVLSATETVFTVSIPVATYCLALFALWGVTAAPRKRWTAPLDRLHAVILVGTALILGALTIAALTGIGMAFCLAILALTPWITVLSYELVGHRTMTAKPNNP